MQYFITLLVLLSFVSCSDSPERGDTFNPNHNAESLAPTGTKTYEEIIEERESLNQEVSTLKEEAETLQEDTEELEPEILSIETSEQKEDEEPVETIETVETVETSVVTQQAVAVEEKKEEPTTAEKETKEAKVVELVQQVPTTPGEENTTPENKDQEQASPVGNVIGSNNNILGLGEVVKPLEEKNESAPEQETETATEEVAESKSVIGGNSTNIIGMGATPPVAANDTQETKVAEQAIVISNKTLNFTEAKVYEENTAAKISFGDLDGLKSLQLTDHISGDKQLLIKSEESFKTQEEAANFCKSIREDFDLVASSTLVNVTSSLFANDNYKTAEMTQFFQDLVFDDLSPVAADDQGVKAWERDKVYIYHWSQKKNIYHLFNIDRILQDPRQNAAVDISKVSADQVKDFLEQHDKSIEELKANKNICAVKNDEGKESLALSNEACEVKPAFCPAPEQEKRKYIGGFLSIIPAKGETCDQEYTQEQADQFYADYLKAFKQFVVDMRTNSIVNIANLTLNEVHENGKPAYCYGITN